MQQITQFVTCWEDIEHVQGHEKPTILSMNEFLTQSITLR